MHFEERQLFIRHWWPLLLVPTVVVAVLLLAVPPKATHPTTGWLTVVGPLLGVAGAALLLTLRLDTRLTPTGAHYRLFPLQWGWRASAWPDVAQAYVRTYDPLGEYGGWGLKGTARNRALNMAGSHGLQLELQTGKRLLLGTQRPDEIKQFLQQLGVPGQGAAPLG